MVSWPIFKALVSQSRGIRIITVLLLLLLLQALAARMHAKLLFQTFVTIFNPHVHGGQTLRVGTLEPHSQPHGAARTEQPQVVRTESSAWNSSWG